jgi:SAM-dependent methyltransferase
MNAYSCPLYYEIAFGFFDVVRQIDCFEAVMRKFSRVGVKRVLDIACGPSVQLREMARRGYEAVGLDNSQEMLAYLKDKEKEEGIAIETREGDMCKFRLVKKTDFAFIMMGSFAFESDKKLLSHLDSVAASLKKGSLYLIQNRMMDWTKVTDQSWTMERNSITVKTTFRIRMKDLVHKIYAEQLTLRVNDHGRTMILEDAENFKFISQQEFKNLIDLNGKFEFLGAWKGDCNAWNFDHSLEEPHDLSNENITVLKR